MIVCLSVLVSLLCVVFALLALALRKMWNARLESSKHNRQQTKKGVVVRLFVYQWIKE